ncbi:type I-F CRISPR-associated helicase Cas3f [Chimaeribacter arupi]|uniref:type I-F CRISPR-associated helicase Cas3f n=1 Tax=Chimaeribacter arupi TaxID=2060066 RepID=UPI002712027E|nr:type I-F CRISPR-associated helicase Cas3f [Chimaeribacter arupi]WKZ92700.1 type I-F CRISPR-associated helicase Cas3f [Chimaeribacter arupi]
MNILLISQCSKQARTETSRILDQFAERKGDRTWQTAITLEGVNTLRRLLRRSARRNTAVACHWLKKNGQSELLWIVGNARCFNIQGTVPTHYTTLDILRSQRENAWICTEAIALLAALAGLFHDFGKAGYLFQYNLCHASVRRYQPFRHEWLSVRLFQAFVGEQHDSEWLALLHHPDRIDEEAILARLKKDRVKPALDPNDHTAPASPFRGMTPLAQTVCWLLLSHHRLPHYQGKNPPDMAESAAWLEQQLDASWNALNHLAGWTEADFDSVWTFPHGLPWRSAAWGNKAHQLAKRALNSGALADFARLDEAFVPHLARLALMLADHHYSSQQTSAHWQDEHYPVWANTDRATGRLKQQLDEHCVGVAHHALLLARVLPGIRRQLPAIARHKGFRERAADARFQWQNKAWECCAGLREQAQQQGFFGINLASTGCGKTFANARIMYALANEQQGCRFTVALGLRTLTLQTGQALRERLHLQPDDLAVMIGSSAARELYEQQHPEPDDNSLSAQALFEEHQYVHYDGAPDNSPLQHWLQKDPKLKQLINAPVLVATIDHLMPATEGTRGGKQLAPMLRLLTSDLVLDEPDDFDLADEYALCRLVNWAGMLGSKVVLSSATLPPSLVQALYIAYGKGRKAYQHAIGQSQNMAVCCAWFDEDKVKPGCFSDYEKFLEAHQDFIAARVARLRNKPAVRQGSIIPVKAAGRSVPEVITAVATTLHEAMLSLHHAHHECHEHGKKVSLGLVRMANIDPLVAVAKALLQCPSPPGTHIHYCVYHSHHPTGIRSHIEQHLDRAFDRRETDALWKLPEVKRALASSTDENHLFVVLATSVVEVGRDWDADWGILECSSVRSMVQFAGRIQRHRRRVPDSPNIFILNKNLRALRRTHPGQAVFCLPGFENPHFRLTSDDVNDVLHEEEYRVISSLPRLIEPPAQRSPYSTYSSLTALEHQHTREVLLGRGQGKLSAALWWRQPLHWNDELQRRTPFRRTSPEEQFFLRMEEEYDTPGFYFRDDGPSGWKEAGCFDRAEVEFAAGVSAWVETDYHTVWLALAEQSDLSLEEVSTRYGELSLMCSPTEAPQAWCFHPLLGVFRALD